MIRSPAVAGRFYPAEPEALRRDLVALTQGRVPPPGPRGVVVVVPHAGYIYSGRIAAAILCICSPPYRGSSIIRKCRAPRHATM